MNMYLGNTLSFALVLLCMVAWTECGEDTWLGKKWGYHHDPEEQQPQNWYKQTPECGKKRQSPIHFYSNQLKYDAKLTDMEFIGYDKMTNNITLFNNGHTVYVFLEKDKAHHIKGAGLPGEYILNSIHLHWGSGNENGSEHWLDSTHYAAEVHYVHYKTNYKNILEAFDSGDGSALAVIGTLIKVEKEDNPAFKVIVDGLKTVPYLDDEKPIPDLRLSDMLPKDLGTYFRYDGSLTTPPCSELVVWTVYQTPITMSQKQIDSFRKELHSINKTLAVTKEIRDGSLLLDNYRPPQSLNGRIVTTNNETLGGKLGISGSPGVFIPFVKLLIILGLLAHLLL